MATSNVDFLNSWIESENVNIPEPVYEALLDICESDIDEEDVGAYCKIKKYPVETVSMYEQLLDYAERVGGAGMSLVEAPSVGQPSGETVSVILSHAIQYVVAKYEGLEDPVSSAFLESVLRPEEAQDVWNKTKEQFDKYFDYPEVAVRAVKNMAGRLK